MGRKRIFIYIYILNIFIVPISKRIYQNMKSIWTILQKEAMKDHIQQIYKMQA